MKNGQILSQASAFLLSVTNTLILTNTIAYYGIRRLRIRHVLIVQAPGANFIASFIVGEKNYGTEHFKKY
jgi:hypothetical protein